MRIWSHVFIKGWDFSVQSPFFYLKECFPNTNKWPNCFWVQWINKTISVQFSCSVVSDSLRLHEPQHARPPCLSPTPRIHSNPSPLCWWCHPTISSPVAPFTSCPQSFPASGYFQMSQLFASGGQSVGDFQLQHQYFQWTPGWTGWISLQPKGLSRVFSNTTVQKHQFFSAQASLWSSYHIHTWLAKTIALTRRTFVGKVMSLLFNMLSSFIFNPVLNMSCDQYYVAINSVCLIFSNGSYVNILRKMIIDILIVNKPH